MKKNESKFLVMVNPYWCNIRKKVFEFIDCGQYKMALEILKKELSTREYKKAKKYFRETIGIEDSASLN